VHATRTAPFAFPLPDRGDIIIFEFSGFSCHVETFDPANMHPCRRRPEAGAAGRLPPKLPAACLWSSHSHRSTFLATGQDQSLTSTVAVTALSAVSSSPATGPASQRIPQ
jgi:hypothetical protein